MFNFSNISKLFKGSFLMILILVILSFVDSENTNKTCDEIIINFSNNKNNNFIDENDVHNLITNHNSDQIIGKTIAEINLKTIEDRIITQRFIKTADVYKDLKGNVLVDVVLRKPIARILSSKKENGYIGFDGTILPKSSKFTTHSMLINGNIFEKFDVDNIKNLEHGKEILKLLDYIYSDKFWRAQISQVEIDNHYNIKMYPQVTKQIIEFGKAEEIEEKFNKLKIFYKKVLPKVGWNTYSRINLEYKNQIITE